MNIRIKQPEFRQWIEDSLRDGENILAISNQGTILHYRGDGEDLVVKSAMGRGPIRALRQRTLLREYEAYRRMEGVAGVPRCHGLVADRYLVLEFIRGTAYREATWADRERWFAEFLEVLQAIHARGVSHGDLKSKGNIMVTEDEKPCVIDFGTAFVSQPGFHPANNWLFEHGRRMDLNAWVKHKYHGRYADVSDEDRELLDYSFIEYWVRKLRGRPMDHVTRR
jgi:serine/threonine protein kinase